MTSFITKAARALLVAWPLAACAADGTVPRATQVDVQRYMGDWYVIAAIPTRMEKDVINPVESYRAMPDGTVGTTYRYRKDAVGGELKTVHAKGFPHADTHNAVWGMQFVWPVKAQYVIAWIDPDYRYVIVARDKRDYVWIMARGPTMPQGQYDSMVQKVAAMGYDVSKLVKPVQQWPEPSPR